jgi:hypothetical protein
MDQQPGAPGEHPQAPADDEDAFWGPSAPPATAEGRHPPLRKWLAGGIGAAVVAAAAFVGINLARNESSTVASAGASGPGAFAPGGDGRLGPPGAGGTVASVDGSRFTVTTPMGDTVTVATSSSTTFLASSAGPLSDIKTGDNVVVMGTTSGNTVDAQRITDSGAMALGEPGGGPPGPSPAGAGGPPTTGVVESVSGTSYAITTASGSTLTVNTSPSTVVNLVKTSSLAALKAGDRVQVTNATGSDGTVSATTVRIGDVGPGPPPGPARP